MSIKRDGQQRRQVRRWIIGKDPRQYGFDFGLWTRQIVARLIDEKFGISLKLTAVGRLLAGMGITPQKPLRRAYERDPKEVKQWLKQDDPRLRRRARKYGATIFFWMRQALVPNPIWGGLIHGSPHEGSKRIRWRRWSFLCRKQIPWGIDSRGTWSCGINLPSNAA